MQTSSPTKATTPGLPRITEIDRHVGASIREHRVLLGLTQAELAELIGVTYQQVHKYERGTDRVSVGRLYQIAGILGVQLAYFFPDQDRAPPSAPPAQQRMAWEIARSFLAIADSRRRQVACELVQALAGDAPAEKIDPADRGRIAA